MCGSKPKIPKPIPAQELKQPDVAMLRKKKPNAAGAGTLLTDGMLGSAGSTGSTTLLGA